MASEISYGEDFRSIGQALEAKNVRSFELKRVGDWYVLQGVPPAEARSGRSCTSSKCDSAADLMLSR